jgi:hypothetical protein
MLIDHPDRDIESNLLVYGVGQRGLDVVEPNLFVRYVFFGK